MTTADIKRLGLILAIQAEIEGMKVENEIIKMKGDLPIYREDSFFQLSINLRDIIHKKDEEL